MLRLLIVLLLIGCKEDMFLAQHGILGRNSNFFIVGIAGDSNAAGRALNEGPTIASGRCYEFDGSGLVELTTNDISTSIVGPDTYGSYAKQFAIDHYARTGQRVVFVAGGVASSTFSVGADTNNWAASPSGVNWDNFITKMDNCLTLLGKAKPDLIIWSLGVNDVTGTNNETTINLAMDSLMDRIEAKYPATLSLWNQIGRNAAAYNTAKFYRCRNNLINNIETHTNQAMCASGLGFIFTTGLEADNIHYNNASQNWYGAACSRFLANASIANKWARGFVSSQFTEVTADVKTAMADLITTMYNASNYFTSESLIFYCADHEYNTRIDACFMSAATTVNGTFVANSCMSLNGTNAYMATSIDPSLFERASSTDVMHMMKVLDNDSGGLVACFLTICNVSTPFVQMSQSGANAIIYRINDGTVSSTAAIAAFGNDKFYTVYRNGTEKGIIEDTTVLASVNVAVTAVPSGVTFHDGAIATPSNFMNVDLQARYAGKQSVITLATLQSKIQAVIDAY